MKTLTPKKMIELAKQLMDLAMEGKNIQVLVRDSQPDGGDFQITNTALTDPRTGGRVLNIWFNSQTPIEK